MRHQQRENGHARTFRLVHRHRIGWRGRLEAHRKKTTSRSGCWTASLSASSGEYTIRTSPPPAFTDNKSRSLPGTRSMSPNEQKITSGRWAICMALSICSIGSHAHRAAGTMHKSYLFGQQLVYPKLDNRMRLPPAHLHDGPRPGRDASNSVRILLRKIGVPVFVNVFHLVPSLSVAGCQ